MLGKHWQNPNKNTLGHDAPAPCFIWFSQIRYKVVFLGGVLKLMSVVGRETVQKHVLLFCLTESRKASTALTLAGPSRCRLAMFPRWSRLPPPLQPIISLFSVLYWFLFYFILFLCCAKSKNKNTSFRDVYLNYDYI